MRFSPECRSTCSSASRSAAPSAASGPSGTAFATAELEVAEHTALEAMQMMGGHAREYGTEGQVRRAPAPPIHGGADGIQREIISRSPGL